MDREGDISATECAMVVEDSLLYAAAQYALDKVYPPECLANRKRVIRKKAEKLVLTREWRSFQEERR